MESVLVTGCSGFIGRYICMELMAKSYYVIGLSCGDAAVPWVHRYINADVAADDFVNDVSVQIDQCDVIVHAAAKIGHNSSDRDLILTNCVGTNRVVQLAYRLRCNQIVNISSAPIIGYPMQHPITEEHPVSPYSLYHITKVAQEHIVDLAKQQGISTVHFRVSAPVGAGMNPKTILPVFLSRCLKDQPITIIGRGSRLQNYIDVRDVASGVEKCIAMDTAKGCYHLASDQTISNLELAKRCIDWTGSHSEIIYSDTPDPEDGIVWDFSIQKAARELGFAPRYSLDDSVRAILEDWKCSS